MQILGIVGTAKNTGKTTTLSALIEEFWKRNINLALTSIGYDGEDLDNLTYLPKPRLFLQENTIAATSELCLENTKAEFEVLHKTNIFTPLGRVLIIKITRPGAMVLAGPNNTFDLKKVISQINTLSPAFLIIDGALNRMAPMYFANKIIFTTGASRNTDIEKLSEEMKIIYSILKLPLADIQNKELNSIFLETTEFIDTGIFSLLENDDLNQLIEFDIRRSKRIYLPNILSLTVLKKFMDYLIENECQNIEITFFEPFRLLLSTYNSSYDELLFLFRNDLKISLLTKPELLAVTVNPFYPKYENFVFTADYVDKRLLLDLVRRKVEVPVYNILEGGVKEIVKKLI